MLFLVLFSCYYNLTSFISKKKKKTTKKKKRKICSSYFYYGFLVNFVVGIILFSLNDSYYIEGSRRIKCCSVTHKAVKNSKTVESKHNFIVENIFELHVSDSFCKH